MCEHVFVHKVSDVRTVDRELGRFVGRLDPNAVPLPEAPGLFAVYDSIARWAESAKTLLAGRVAEAHTWERAGHRCAAEQLAAMSGSSVSAARNMLETSKQLEALPATADAMRAGKLSRAKAEAIASAATVAPEAEARLLAKADAPVAVVREECLKAKALDRDAAHARIRRQRYAREYTDAEGAWNFVARGTPEDGARFRFAHEPIVDEMFRVARAQDHRESREAYAFDAFIALAERTTAPDADKTKKPAPRFIGFIRADIEALQRGSVEGDEVCEIAGLGPIPVTIARELLGDAILKLVITKGVDVANVSLKKSHRFPRFGRAGSDWRRHECENEGQDAEGGRDLLPDLLGPSWGGARRGAAGGAVPQTCRRSVLADRKRLYGQRSQRIRPQAAAGV
jgi:hypothetical protein